MTAAITVPLTALDETKLVELEAIVEKGMDTFIVVGTALAEIQSSRLYRATHDTFESYVRDRFDISRPRAYELISAAQMTISLSAMADNPAPQNERQARALVGLSPETAAQVMVEADEQTEGNITAAAIDKARTEVAPKQLRFTQPRVVDRHAPEHQVDDGDAESQLDEAIVAIGSELRGLGRAPRFQVAIDKELLAVADEVRRLAQRVRTVRERVDPVLAIVSALTAQYPNYTPEVIEHDVSMAISGMRSYTLNADALRKRIAGKYDTFAGNDTVTNTATVIIEVGHRTAVVVSGWPHVRNVLQLLGIASMRDHETRKMAFPAARADDVQAAVEMRHLNVELRRDSR